MDLYQSKLPNSPEPLPEENNLFSVELSYGKDSDSSHLHVTSFKPELSSSLASFFMPFREEGREWMRGHEGYFFLAIPAPGAPDPCARLHVAVRYMEGRDLDFPGGVRHLHDFDRLMDVVQSVTQQVVEAGLMQAGSCPVEIIPEPLNIRQRLKTSSIRQVGLAIGASGWLTHANRPVFEGYRSWSADQNRWE